VGLLDLVEEHHGERLAAHLLGELAALLEADEPGGAPNSRETVCFSPNSLMSSEISAPSSSNRNSASALASSVFPTPVGPAKMNEPRALRVLEAGALTADRRLRAAIASSWPMTRWCSAFSMKTRRLVSSSVSLKTGMPVACASTSAISPRRRPRGRDVAAAPLLLEAQALGEQLLLVAQAAAFSKSCSSMAAPSPRGPWRSSRRTRAAPAGGQDRQAQARAGLVDQVDRLVGQEPVADVAVGEVRRRDDRAVGDLHLVVRLVAVAQALEDVDRVGQARLGDLDRLEAALERGVLLEVLAVLVERRGADGLQLAAGQQRLEDEAASIAPSAAPAPTRVWISSMNTMMSPRVRISLVTFFRRSSKSPR
jgi:hypothetical protein